MIGITELANEYLATDDYSSISMSLSISQKGQNFEILAHQKDFDGQDIKTLSGAEKSTVNRALATAMAFSNKSSTYGLYSFDETDSALSDTNKKAFSKNIVDISNNEFVDQLFIISHDKEVVDLVGANLINIGSVL